MKFNAFWITNRLFENLEPTDVMKIPNKLNVNVNNAVENHHVHFIKAFSASKGEKYTMRISADDYYKLYINGEFVCQGPAPGYVDRYNYNEIDISKHINDGENIIAAHVYYQGLINRVWNSGDNRMGLIADVFCDSEFMFGTDETWLCETAHEYSGSTTPYYTQFREDIVFSRKNKEWKTNAKSGEYVAARIDKHNDRKFAECPVPTVDTYMIKPKSVEMMPPVDGCQKRYLIDFGEETAGVLSMTARDKSDEKSKGSGLVCVKYGEELNADKSVRYIMRCNCMYYDICTLSGGEDLFEFYDYKAFRYVQIDCSSDTIEIENICAYARHHKFDERLTLTTDVPNLKGIWDICKNGVKWCVQEGYIDCPSREKGQYLGDFTVSGLAHLYLTGDAEMYKKTLFDFAHSMNYCDGMLAVAPGSYKQEIADFSLQYPIQVMNYYRCTKDAELLKKLLPTVQSIIGYFEKHENDTGLIENVTDKWNIVDWPMNLRDGYSIDMDGNPDKIPVHNVINAYYIGAVQILEEIQEILGLMVQNKSDKLKRAFLKVFYDKKQKCFFDDAEHTHSALHSNVLPLYFGFAPPQAFENIKNIIMKKGFACGVQFSYFVLKALGKIGAYKEEFELLTNESEHSWVNMLREGATACFEAWGKDQKWNTSLCHAWASAPIIALAEDILKVDFDDERPSVYTKSFTIDNKQYKAELKLK